MTSFSFQFYFNVSNVISVFSLLLIITACASAGDIVPTEAYIRNSSDLTAQTIDCYTRNQNLSLQNIKWYKGSRTSFNGTSEIQNKTGKYLVRYAAAFSTLTIYSITKEDVGVYTCFVGVNQSAEVLIISSAFIDISNNATSSIGETARLDCSAWGYPISDFTWYFQGVPVVIDDNKFSLQGVPPSQSDLDYYYSGNSTLVIKNVQFLDAGEYTCMVDGGDVGLQYRLTMLFIPGTPKLLSRGAVILEPRDRAQVQLQCLRYPAGPLSVRWYKENTDKSRVEITNKAGKFITYPSNGTLIVKDVGEEDVGRYICTQEGMDEGIAVIASKPFVEEIENREVAISETLRLDCKAWGFPAPKIIWYWYTPVNGKSTRMESNSTLVITAFQKEDEDIYTCRATNVYGSHSNYGYFRLLVTTTQRLTSSTQRPITDKPSSTGINSGSSSRTHALITIVALIKFILFKT